MSKQPEALRLADTTTSLRGWKWADDVEAELRRQHALIEELREVLEECAISLIDSGKHAMAEIVEDTLAKAEAQQ